MCEASSRRVGTSFLMNSICTNSGGIAPWVGHPGVGMNLISSMPCTSARAMLVVGGGDVLMVGNKDVVEDVGGQVPLRTMDGD